MKYSWRDRDRRFANLFCGFGLGAGPIPPRSCFGMLFPQSGCLTLQPIPVDLVSIYTPEIQSQPSQVAYSTKYIGLDQA